MKRGIAFDHEQALEQATAVFWKWGYAGASVRDLLKATGIGEGSFYNTLKSKKQLYLDCLDRYAGRHARHRQAALMSAPTASLGIRAMFGVMLDSLDDPGTPSRICMLAGMLTEDTLADADFRRLVERIMESFREKVTFRLEHDREAGLLPPTLDPRTSALVIQTYAQGLWRMALVDYDRSSFERQIDVFLKGLGL